MLVLDMSGTLLFQQGFAPYQYESFAYIACTQKCDERCVQQLLQILPWLCAMNFLYDFIIKDNPIHYLYSLGNFFF